MTLQAITEMLRAAKGLSHKSDIAPILARLGLGATSAIPVGDDCAAIPDGDGFLLLAIEGFMPEFVAADPHFAGYCGVMVNLSDVAAMGGRPIAVVDAIWSAGEAQAAPIMAGLAEASTRYGVPVIGGHTNTRAAANLLSVAILGRAKTLLTSFDAQPGDTMIAAIDLRGRMRDPAPYWDASSAAPAARLRADLEILPKIAEQKLALSAKDISMAGVVGTALMLLEASRLGGVIDINAVPRPPSVPLERWLLAFPSYGYLLSVRPENTNAVIEEFAARGIAAAAIGSTDSSRIVRLRNGAEDAVLWRFEDSVLVGARHEKAEDRTLHTLHQSARRCVHTLELGHALAQAGHDVTIHAPDPSGKGFFRKTAARQVSIKAAPALTSLREMIAQRIGEIAAHVRGDKNHYDIYHAQDSINANALADCVESKNIGAFIRTVHHVDAYQDQQLLTGNIEAFTRQRHAFASAMSGRRF